MIPVRGRVLKGSSTHLTSEVDRCRKANDPLRQHFDVPGRSDVSRLAIVDNLTNSVDLESHGRYAGQLT